jgi:hypothetical protein
VENGKVISVDTTNVYVLYKNELVAYRYPVFTSLTSNSIRYKYFVTKRDSAFGYCYDDGNEKNIYTNKRFSYDEIVNQKTFINKVLAYEVFQNAAVRLLSARYNADSSELTEHYSVTAKTGNAEIATMHLLYTSHLEGINYTLSKPLDSIMQLKNTGRTLKLATVGIDHKPWYNEANKTLYSRRKTYYHLEEVLDFDREEAEKYFNRYQKAIQ